MSLTNTTRQPSDEQKRKAVARTKKWKQENPEKHKAQHNRRCKKRRADWYLENKYGISRAQHDAVFKAQGFVCAICKTDAPPKDTWNTDHDHMTGKVRGLLCSNCNWMLGHARDDTGFLANAISYLQNPPANAVIH